MAIRDRIKEAIDKLNQKDPVNALIQVSIAIDGTGRKCYPKKNTTDRCKFFLRDNQYFITRVAFGKLEIQGDIYFDLPDAKTGKRGKTLEEVLYHLVRCSLLHEGTMPEEVHITDDASIGMTEDGKVIISVNLIWALILAVIGADVNSSEILPLYYTASIGETTVRLNDLWGKKDEIYNLVYDHNK